jgi:hypothetical protein
VHGSQRRKRLSTAIFTKNTHPNDKDPTEFTAAAQKLLGNLQVERRELESELDDAFVSCENTMKLLQKLVGEDEEGGGRLRADIDLKRLFSSVKDTIANAIDYLKK